MKIVSIALFISLDIQIVGKDAIFVVSRLVFPVVMIDMVLDIFKSLQEG